MKIIKSIANPETFDMEFVVKINQDIIKCINDFIGGYRMCVIHSIFSKSSIEIDDDFLKEIFK